MNADYAMTPAAVVLAGLGEYVDSTPCPAHPNMTIAQFTAELAERRQAVQRVYESRGLVGPDGSPTPHAAALADIAREHQRHMTGANWHSVDDDAMADITRQIAVNARVRAVMDSAIVYGPADPVPMTRWELAARAQVKALPGVPNG